MDDYLLMSAPPKVVGGCQLAAAPAGLTEAAGTGLTRVGSIMWQARQPHQPVVVKQSAPASSSVLLAHTIGLRLQEEVGGWLA